MRDGVKKIKRGKGMYGMVACLQLLLHVIVSVQAGGK